ncbi:hypothetical protein SteCoe_27889 [Stentor coeruleus]|uniref:Uncharacterized protein n=1 Tax=Stentor coeruleus TaxID=5963 RepID=A0A1R2B9G7_9CILI|nr:hypothetical protein SteCoe_27889 [Stentor coeruleus]
MSQDGEEVGDKLDRLNFAINQLMVDLGDTRLHTSRISMISSIHQSFCETYEDLAGDDEDVYAEEVPEYFLDKFQESLTEIDRLSMQVEDFWAEKNNRAENNIDICLNQEQIKKLYNSLGEFLSEDKQNSIFKLSRNSISVGAIKIECDDSVERICQLEVENINLRSQILSNSVKRNKSSISEAPDCEKLISQQLEIDTKSLEIARKEQELQKLQEEAIYKNTQVEMLIHEYSNKLEEAKIKNSNRHDHIRRKNPSQDFTRTRTPISMLNTNSASFMNGLLNTRQEIESKLALIEKLVKSKYKKKGNKKQLPNIKQGSGNFGEFKFKEQKFAEKLKKYQSFPRKEKFILEYLKEQQEFLNEKYEELRKYEITLQETWVGPDGQVNAIDAAKKASANYFYKKQEMKREREIIEEKFLRLTKLKETIKKGNCKLQEHRKKILNERQKLQKQQNDLEKYLQAIVGLHKKKLLT